MKLSQIKPNPNNPRVIKDERFAKLVKSISEFPKMMELRPMVINEDNIVLGGNMRLKALKELGYTELPEGWVKKASELTEEEQRRFIIADNVGFGDHDWEMLANEWDVQELSNWGLEIPDFAQDVELEAEEDDYEVPEVVHTDIVLGDLFEIGEHRLLCGDSTNINDTDKVLNGNKIDLVFTDPPYNINYQGVKDKRDKIKNDKMSDDDFCKFLYDALNVQSDTFYVCCSWQYSHLFRKSLEDLQKPVKAFIVWDKVNPAQHLDMYYKQHEIILYHGKFGGQKTLRGDVWQIKREKNTVHPTMKPINLISIALNDNPNKKVIYDAFLGSGSTMVACHQLNRKCYGIELDPKYCQVIIERMLKLDPSLEIKRNGVKYEVKLNNE